MDAVTKNGPIQLYLLVIMSHVGWNYMGPNFGDFFDELLRKEISNNDVNVVVAVVAVVVVVVCTKRTNERTNDRERRG